MTRSGVVSLLTFARQNPKDEIGVRVEIAAINRLLERTYPDCTCCIFKAGDSDLPSEWVTVKLEITRESLDCLDWYMKQATTRRLVLSAWRARQVPTLDTDLTSVLIAREA